MSCECYQVGGRFIAEDPDCPAHGREAQERERVEGGVRSELISRMQVLRQHGTPQELETGFCEMLAYLESLD